MKKKNNGFLVFVNEKKRKKLNRIKLTIYKYYIKLLNLHTNNSI